MQKNSNALHQMLVATYFDNSDANTKKTSSYFAYSTAAKQSLDVDHLDCGRNVYMVGNAGRKTTVEAKLKAGKHPL
jgi:hypothetical protein